MANYLSFHPPQQRAKANSGTSQGTANESGEKVGSVEAGVENNGSNDCDSDEKKDEKENENGNRNEGAVGDEASLIKGNAISGSNDKKPTVKLRVEPFTSISIPIEGHKSVEECLKAYTTGETMSGDNQYE